MIGGYIGDWLMITGWAKRWVLERFQKQGKAPPIGEDFFPLVGGGKRPAASKTPCHAVDAAGAMGQHSRYPRHTWLGLRHRHGLDYRPRESRCHPSQYLEGLTGRLLPFADAL